MNETLAEIGIHLAREAYAATLAAWVDGTGTQGAVEAAEARLERCQLAAEMARPVAMTSAYLTNRGR
jgi:hypothetical protein